MPATGAEPKFLPADEPTNAVADWTVRGGVALFFLLFGIEKFSSEPGSHWVTLFQQIGAGDWFRYFTGFVEVAGGVLVLVPRTALAGFVLLACTMGAAALILMFVLGHPADGAFPGILLAILIAIGWSRWRPRGGSEGSYPTSSRSLK
jgi:putative oxidoreductase